jgi:hypothetical protein
MVPALDVSLRHPTPHIGVMTRKDVLALRTVMPIWARRARPRDVGVRVRARQLLSRTRLHPDSACLASRIVSGDPDASSLD